MTYDDQNIFAKILRGEIPCERVYEDEHSLAFMDIMPRADGHVLVIPKTPVRNILDATPEQLSACLATVQTISHAMRKGLAADGITLQQFSEAAGGQEVFHLHFHVLPRHDGVKLRPPGTMGDKETIRDTAAKIKQGLSC